MIRVLIAEDMHMIRGALVALLTLEDDMEVVAQLDRGDKIVETALRTRPDVAIVDIDLPGLDGLTAAERLHEQLPAAPWCSLASASLATCCVPSRRTSAGSSSRMRRPRHLPTACAGSPRASG
jgi:DNA-binding NarL/FixJ family response regulator